MIKHKDELFIEERFRVTRVFWRGTYNTEQNKQTRRELLDHYRGNLILNFARDPKTNTARLQDIITLLPHTIQINDFRKEIQTYFRDIRKASCTWKRTDTLNVNTPEPRPTRKCAPQPSSTSFNLDIIFNIAQDKIKVLGSENSIRRFIHAYCVTINKLENQIFSQSQIDILFSQTTVNPSQEMDNIITQQPSSLTPSRQPATPSQEIIENSDSTKEQNHSISLFTDTETSQTPIPNTNGNQELPQPTLSTILEKLSKLDKLDEIEKKMKLFQEKVIKIDQIASDIEEIKKTLSCQDSRIADNSIRIDTIETRLNQNETVQKSRFENFEITQNEKRGALEAEVENIKVNLTQIVTSTKETTTKINILEQLVQSLSNRPNDKTQANPEIVPELITQPDLLIFGDSNAHKIRTDIFHHNSKCIKFYTPLLQDIVDKLPSLTNLDPKRILLHCATNDIKDNNIDEVCQKLSDITGAIRNKFPKARLILSGLLPRKSNENNKTARAINEYIEDMAEETPRTKFLSHSNISQYMMHDEKHLHQRYFASIFLRNLRYGIFNEMPSYFQKPSFDTNRRDQWHHRRNHHNGQRSHGYGYRSHDYDYDYDT